MFVADSATLAEFCARASAAPLLAVDTEFLRERTYFPTLCLLQLGTHKEQVAIDTLAGLDLRAVGRLMADPSLPKVFHACSQDVEILAQLFGEAPRNVFDTQVAAAFLGERAQMGYGQLVEAYTGVHLAKAASLTDWSRRPLDADQIAYAEDDVRYLPAIHDRMVERLEDLGRLAWMREECEAAVAHAARAHDPSEAYLHVKRASTLSRKQLAILRETARWRDELAQRRNIPRKWVLSDDVLVEVARLAPTSPERLRRIRGTAQLSEADGDRLLLAVRHGLSCPPERRPRHERYVRPSQEVESVVELLYALVRLIAQEEGIAVPLIAHKDDLYALAQGRDAGPLTVGWRAEVAGRRLRALLAGEVGLTVRDGSVVVL